MTISLATHSKGYLLLRVDGDEVERVGPRFLAVHRLAAYAWGDLDGLDDPREVDHLDAVPCHNSEANLDAVEPEDHGRRTRRRAQERRGDA